MPRIQLNSILLLAALTVCLTGCSRSPVAPEVSTSGDAGASFVLRDDAPPEEPNGGGTAVQTVSEDLPRNQEGLLHVGRFTLKLPKDALLMPATVTMWVDDPAAMDVHIEVSPAEASNLKSAAKLTADLSDRSDINYKVETMFRWVDGAWVELKDTDAHKDHQHVFGKSKQLGWFKVDAR